MYYDCAIERLSIEIKNLLVYIYIYIYIYIYVCIYIYIKVEMCRNGYLCKRWKRSVDTAFVACSRGIPFGSLEENDTCFTYIK